MSMELLFGILIGWWLKKNPEHQPCEQADPTREQEQEQWYSQAHWVWASAHPRAAKIELLLAIIVLPIGIWAIAFWVVRVFPYPDTSACVAPGGCLLRDWGVWIYQEMLTLIWWLFQLLAALALVGDAHAYLVALPIACCSRARSGIARDWAAPAESMLSKTLRCME